MTRKHIVITAVALLVLVTGIVVFRVFNPAVGFTYYEPAYLPSGISIKAKRISISKYGPTQVQLNFRTEDWVYSIREYRATDGIGTAEQNYDPKSPEPTCSIKTSSQMIKYRLCHWIDYGRISVHEIKFIKKETFINTQIPTKTNETISIDEISKFVDSFNKKSTIGLPVLRSSGA